MTSTPAELELDQRPSVFSRFNPFDGKRRALIREVKAILTADHDETRAIRQRALDSMDEMDRALHETVEEFSNSLYTTKPAAMQVKSMLFRFNTETLECIVREFGSGRFHGAANFIKKNSDGGDISLREAVFFRKQLGDTFYGFRLLDDLRSSHEDFMKKDLSKLEGITKERASAILRISTCLCERFSSQLGSENQLVVGSGIVDFPDRKSLPVIQLSSSLVLVVFDHLNRVDDIILYMEERLGADEKVDAGHLRQYLELDAKSLGSGVL